MAIPARCKESVVSQFENPLTLTGVRQKAHWQTMTISGLADIAKVWPRVASSGNAGLPKRLDKAYYLRSSRDGMGLSQ